MSTRRHRQQKIAEFDLAWGQLVAQMPSADNRSCALMFKAGEIETDIGGWPVERLAFGGKLLAETTGALRDVSGAMSPDGTKFATFTQIHDESGSRYEIAINGQSQWTMFLDTIHYSGWIDNDRLVWNGWNDGDDPGGIDERGIRIFVNGREEGHGVTHFQCVHVDGRLWAAEVVEDGKIYSVFDDGTRTEPAEIDPDWGDPRPVGFRYANDPEVLATQPHVEEKDRMTRVRYRNAVSAPVDAVAKIGLAGHFAVSPDESRVAYAAVRHGRLITAINQWLFRSMQLDEYRALAKNLIGNVEELLAKKRLPDDVVTAARFAISCLQSAAKRRDPDAIKEACTSLHDVFKDTEDAWKLYSQRDEKKPEGLKMWAIALLANPYFGPLHVMQEASKRFYPSQLTVDGKERNWRTGYRWVKSMTYLPDNALAVHAVDAKSQRVVVDQKDGPSFDRIENLRVGLDGELSYCAIRGNEVFRVTVA